MPPTKKDVRPADVIPRDGTPDGPAIGYMAHPVGGAVENNLARARRWLKYLNSVGENAIYIAPWIVECEIYDDNDPAQRESSLRRVCEVIKRCDFIALVGGRGSAGMAREAAVAVLAGVEVIDLTGLGEEPPTEAT